MGTNLRAVVVVMVSPSGSAYMRGEGRGRCWKRWGISPGSHSPGTHLWFRSSHHWNAIVLPPN